MNQLTDAAGNPIALPSRAVWETRRAEVLAAMQEVMGPLPGTEKRVSLDVRLREEVDCGSYVRRLIDYASEPGGRVPAYLLIPKEQGPFPAVLCLHPTDDVVGHGVVVGLGQGQPRLCQRAGRARFCYVSPCLSAFGAVSSRLGGAGLRQRNDESDLGQRARVGCVRGMDEVRAEGSVRSVIHWEDITRSTRPPLMRASRWSFRAAGLIPTRPTKTAISLAGRLRAICRGCETMRWPRSP